MLGLVFSLQSLNHFGKSWFLDIKKQLADIIDEARSNYSEWMRPETMQAFTYDRYSWKSYKQQWHQYVRSRFRAYLFELVGSYEMAVFFLVVPFNAEYLRIFQDCVGRYTKGNDVLWYAKQCVRRRETRG